MVGIVRAIGLGLLVVAIAVHIVGFATPYWVSAKLDMRGISSMMSANNMGSPLLNQIGMDINMGLWKYCMKSNLGQLIQKAAAMSQAGQGMDGQDKGQDSDWQNGGSDLDKENNFGPTEGEMKEDSNSVGDVFGGTTMAICKAAEEKDTPGWMKAVRGLGVVSLIVAVVGVAAILYSCFGDGKGDRARLMPFIIAGICVVAGVLLLIGTAVYGAEFEVMMQNMMSQYDRENSGLQDLVKNVEKNTHFGYSFALEAVAGVLMLLTSVVVAIPAMKGWDSSVQFSGPRNMAV